MEARLADGRSIATRELEALILWGAARLLRSPRSNGVQAGVSVLRKMQEAREARKQRAKGERRAKANQKRPRSSLSVNDLGDTPF